MSPEVPVSVEPAVTAEPVAVRRADAALVDRARFGDAAAFEALIGPRLDGLLRTAWAIVGNRPDAEEAAQEACVSAWRELPRLRDVDRFDAWLGRVLVNHCRMSLRRRSRVREIGMPHELDAIDPARGPAGVEDADAVARAFDSLDVDARALLVLHHLQGEPVARIAAALSIPPGTVKSRLHAARQALERSLAGGRS